MDNINHYKEDNMYSVHFCDKFKNKKYNKEISIFYSFKKINNTFERTIYLTLKNGSIIGEFSIEGNGLNHQFDSGETNSMRISIEDPYQGFGYTKIMIKLMIDKIYEDIPKMNGEQMLFIDGDGSDGFWDKIGMQESKRYGYDRIPKYASREGAGYEKFITINNIYKFCRI